MRPTAIVREGDYRCGVVMNYNKRVVIPAVACIITIAIAAFSFRSSPTQNPAYIVSGGQRQQHDSHKQKQFDAARFFSDESFDVVQQYMMTTDYNYENENTGSWFGSSTLFLPAFTSSDYYTSGTSAPRTEASRPMQDEDDVYASTPKVKSAATAGVASPGNPSTKPETEVAPPTQLKNTNANDKPSIADSSTSTKDDPHKIIDDASVDEDQEKQLKEESVPNQKQQSNENNVPDKSESNKQADLGVSNTVTSKVKTPDLEDNSPNVKDKVNTAKTDISESDEPATPEVKNLNEDLGVSNIITSKSRTPDLKDASSENENTAKKDKSEAKDVNTVTSKSAIQSETDSVDKSFSDKEKVSGVTAAPPNTIRKNEPDPDGRTSNTCQPMKHFVMTKIEKTGSSTLFSVFARFTRINKLNILTQTAGWHIDWRSKRHKGWEIGPQHVDVADVLINHARYNETIFNQYMPSDFKWIVPIREPESWFKSAAKYFSPTPVHNPESIIEDDKLMYIERGGKTGVLSFYHLPQLQWLGLDYHKHKNNITAIKEYIDYITPKIDIPMLNDQFDASLVLLRRKLCWSYPDLFYKTYVVTHSERTTISDSAREKLLSEKVNLGEKLLYDRMNQTWWSSPEVKESDFWLEVDHFKELNKEVSHSICKQVKESNKAQTVPASKWHPSFQITTVLCDFLNSSKAKMVKGTCTWALGKLFKTP